MTQLTTKQYFNQPAVQGKFKELLGQKSAGFVTSVLQAVASNPQLQQADPSSVYNSAAVAAILDLPINQSIGHAYIIPYKVRQKDGSYKNMAQFQIGYKGFRQLALRSGQFKTINESDVREGEIKSHNRLSGEIEFEWIQDSKARNEKAIVGYVSYFKLINGYEQTFYMSKEEVQLHAKKYSQSFKSNFGQWVDNFDVMALKTVIKLNLSKNAPLSTEMQKAINVDQSVIKDDSGDDVEYTDHEVMEEPDHELERIVEFINKCESKADLEMLMEGLEDDVKAKVSKQYEEKFKQLKK